MNISEGQLVKVIANYSKIFRKKLIQETEGFTDQDVEFFIPSEAKFRELINFQLNLMYNELKLNDFWQEEGTQSVLWMYSNDMTL